MVPPVKRPRLAVLAQGSRAQRREQSDCIFPALWATAPSCRLLGLLTSIVVLEAQHREPAWSLPRHHFHAVCVTEFHEATSHISVPPAASAGWKGGASMKFSTRYFKNLPRKTLRESLHSQSEVKGEREDAVAGAVQLQTQGGSNASSSWNTPPPLYKRRLCSKAGPCLLLSPTTAPHFHPTWETHWCPAPHNLHEKWCEVHTEIKRQG